jgi:glycosyltransferase involved in cell wall biosynthesis
MPQTKIDVASYQCLSKKLSHFFGPQPFVIVDAYNPSYLKQIFQKTKTQSGPLHIVFLGGFLGRFLNAGLWPSHPYQLWVMCHSAKTSLTRITGLEPSLIGVIPRYQLFPVQKRPQKFPTLGKPMTLIFAGRISRVKGVFTILAFANRLQMHHRLPIKLVFLGEFAETQPADRSAPLISSAQLKEQVYARIKSLSWSQAPDFVHSLGPSEWTKLKWENPIFVSLSQLTHEDFGVSLAQAQALGWPCILSDWGAHRDAKQSNVWYAPEIDNFSPFSEIRIASVKMAQQFMEFLIKPAVNASTASPKQDPKKIDAKRIRLGIQQANLWFKDATPAAENSFVCYIKTSAGKRLFEIYREAMKGNPS